jgi:hypothetical protein
MMNDESQSKNTQFGHPDIHREFALTLWNGLVIDFFAGFRLTNMVVKS